MYVLVVLHYDWDTKNTEVWQVFGPFHHKKQAKKAAKRFMKTLTNEYDLEEFTTDIQTLDDIEGIKNV